jgi:hypothetical protein
VSLVGEDVQLGDEDEGVHKGGEDGLDDVVAAEPKIDCAITVYETKTETIRVDPVTQTVTVVAAPVTVTTSNSILIWMTTTPTTTQTTTTTLPVSTLVTTATVTETHTAVWTTTSTATTTDTQFWAVPTQNNYGGDDWRRGE